MTDIKWPEGATHKIESFFKKWIDGVEYNFEENEWVKSLNSWSLDTFKKFGNFKVIERPIDPPYMPEVGEWFTAASGDEYMLIGKTNYGHFVAETRQTVLSVFSSLGGARPIKTDREQFIEKARESDGGTYSIVEIFGKLYDSGARFK
jgi:hypothetical protein